MLLRLMEQVDILRAHHSKAIIQFTNIIRSGGAGAWGGGIFYSFLLVCVSGWVCGECIRKCGCSATLMVV